MVGTFEPFLRDESGDGVHPRDHALRFVDKFNRNALPASVFEARVGKGRFLVCTLDISSNLETRIAARQLRRSIDRYLAGDQFQPRAELNLADLKNLFRAEPSIESHP